MGGITLGTTLINLAGQTALFAENGDAAAPGGGMLGMMLPFIAIFALFYFLLIRPQRREQSRRQAMLSAVKKNDRVLTAGGIYGVVAAVNRESDEVTIKVDETSNTKLRMTLSSIARVIGDDSSNQSEGK